MKHIILKFAWWLDSLCHRVIEWADPIKMDEKAVREAIMRMGRIYDEKMTANQKE